MFFEDDQLQILHAFRLHFLLHVELPVFAFYLSVVNLVDLRIQMHVELSFSRADVQAVCVPHLRFLMLVVRLFGVHFM